MRSRKVVFGILGGTISALFVVLLVLGGIRAGEAAYDIGYRIFTEPPMEEPPGHDKKVYVDEGTSGMELGRQLEEKGLVDSGMLFALQLGLSSYRGKIQAGDYTLNTSQDAGEMMQVMAGDDQEDAEGAEDAGAADSEGGEDAGAADSESGEDADAAGTEDGGDTQDSESVDGSEEAGW